MDKEWYDHFIKAYKAYLLNPNARTREHLNRTAKRCQRYMGIPCIYTAAGHLYVLTRVIDLENI